MLPSLGMSAPAINCNKVDFPEPFGPVIAYALEEKKE
jgi:hypothetical protein